MNCAKVIDKIELVFVVGPKCNTY